MVFEPFKSGDIFEEKYELLDQIGSGAFAVVYRARDLEIGRDLAIKILLNQSPAFDESTIDRFRLEARTLSRLHHPNSLTLYGFGWTKDHQPFLVTEYVPGQTLRRLLDLEHRLLVPRAVALTRQILLALRDAHAKGVVHRDIKPNNVMIFDRVGEKDVVKVLDFGIAKLVDAIYEEDQELQNLTLRGKVLGTPRYMAPELLCDDGVRPSSDLYSVGLLLYEMITGEEAVKGTDPVQIISRQVGPDPPIAPDDPTIPDPLRAVLLKATTKAVHDRLQSAQEFIDILDTIDIRALAQWRPPKLDPRARDLPQADASPYARSSATRQAATRFVRLAEAAQRLVKGLKGNDSAATVVEAPQLPPDPRVGRSTVTHGRPASTIAPSTRVAVRSDTIAASASAVRVTRPSRWAMASARSHRGSPRSVTGSRSASRYRVPGPRPSRTTRPCSTRGASIRPSCDFDTPSAARRSPAPTSPRSRSTSSIVACAMDLSLALTTCAAARPSTRSRSSPVSERPDPIVTAWNSTRSSSRTFPGQRSARSTSSASRDSARRGRPCFSLAFTSSARAIRTTSWLRSRSGGSVTTQ